MVAAVRPSLPGLQFVWHLGDDAWHHWLAHHEQASVEALRTRKASLSPSDPINIQYTSGTTGNPKGATLTHHNILNNGFWVGEGCGYTRARPGLHPGAAVSLLRHGAWATSVAPRHGATMVYPAPRSTPLAHARGRGAGTVHAPVRRADDVHRGARPPEVRRVRPVLAAHRDHGRLTVPGRGDEAGVIGDARRRGHDRLRDDGNVAGLQPDGPDDTIELRVGTVGRVHPHVEDQDRRPASGEVAAARRAWRDVHSRVLGDAGYWNNPERTAEAIDADGWMHTGDLAVMDADGYVNIVGRIKDMVIRGGENIYPREVEELLTHPEIADVQVIGVPDVRYGRGTDGLGRAARGARLRRATMCAGTAASGSRTSRSRVVEIGDEFPMTVTGKVQKYRMREESIRLHGLEAAASVNTA